jgi:hypothetical protein
MMTLGSMRGFTVDEGLGAYGNRYIEGPSDFDAEETGLRNANDLERFAIEQNSAADR